jgi:ABC-type methionine transport system ATPase subunit
MKKTLLTTVKKFTRNRPPEDDQTLVVVGFEEVPAGSIMPVIGYAGAGNAEAVN